MHKQEHWHCRNLVGSCKLELMQPKVLRSLKTLPSIPCLWMDEPPRTPKPCTTAVWHRLAGASLPFAYFITDVTLRNVLINRYNIIKCSEPTMSFGIQKSKKKGRLPLTELALSLLERCFEWECNYNSILTGWVQFFTSSICSNALPLSPCMSEWYHQHRLSSISRHQTIVCKGTNIFRAKFVFGNVSFFSVTAFI